MSIHLLYEYKDGSIKEYLNITPFLLRHGGTRGIPTSQPKVGRPTFIRVSITEEHINDPYVQSTLKNFHQRIHPLSETLKLRIKVRNPQ